MFCYIEKTGRTASDPFVSSDNIVKTYKKYKDSFERIKNIKEKIFLEVGYQAMEVVFDYLKTLRNAGDLSEYQKIYSNFLNNLKDIEIKDNIIREKNILLNDIENFIENLENVRIEEDMISFVYYHIDSIKTKTVTTGMIIDNKYIDESRRMNININDTVGDFYYILKIFKLYNELKNF